MKAVVIMMMLLFAAGKATCQVTPGNKENLIKTLFPERTDFNFLLKALNSSVCLVRQDYTLVNAAGKEFGANSKPYWDMKLTVGVAAGGNIYTSAGILYPWKDDNDLKEFLKTDTQHLSPHSSNRYYKRITDSNFIALKSYPVGDRLPDTPMIAKQDSVKTKKSKRGKLASSVENKKRTSDSVSINQQPADSLIIAFPLPDSISTIPGSNNIADTSGWLVLISSSSDGEVTDTTKLSLHVVSPMVATKKASSKTYVNNIPVKENLLGGIYYTVQYSLGRMLFSATGLLCKDAEGWFINYIKKSNALQTAGSQ